MSEDRRPIFEKESYLSPITGYPERPLSWFKENILPDAVKEFKDKKRLLDVGCAFGYYTFEFSPYFESVLGIDFAKNRIDFAKNFKSTNVDFKHTRIEDFESDIKFDAMFTSMVIQHIPMDAKIKSFEALYNVSAEDCVFLMYDFNWNNEELTNGWVDPISPRWIKKYISHLWICESCDEFIRESPGPLGMMYRYKLKRV